MDQLSFEQAYARLEEILEALNSGKVALEHSLHLYEEAERLNAAATQKLRSAEKKIEVLVKNRAGELTLDPHGMPLKEEFVPK